MANQKGIEDEEEMVMFVFDSLTSQGLPVQKRMCDLYVRNDCNKKERNRIGNDVKD